MRLDLRQERCVNKERSTRCGSMWFEQVLVSNAGSGERCLRLPDCEGRGLVLHVANVLCYHVRAHYFNKKRLSSPLVVGLGVVAGEKRHLVVCSDNEKCSCSA